jgi:hypothetical protein
VTVEHHFPQALAGNGCDPYRTEISWKIPVSCVCAGFGHHGRALKAESGNFSSLSWESLPEGTSGRPVSQAAKKGKPGRQELNDNKHDQPASGEHLRRNFQSTVNPWHKLHDAGLSATISAQSSQTSQIHGLRDTFSAEFRTGRFA